MDAVVVIARISLAAVFLVSGFAKLFDRDGTRAAVEAFGLPAALVGPVAAGLPAAEIATAAGLVLGTTARAGAVAALVLLSAFIVGIAVNIAQGRRPDCHCFGQLHSAPVGPATLARNAVLAIAAGLVLFGAGADAGGPVFDTLGDLDAAGAVAATVTFALVAAAVVLSGRKGAALISAPVADPPPAPAGPPVGSDAPAFTLRGSSGSTTGLGDLVGRGRSVLLVFFSPSCSPCAHIAPELARWQRELPERLTVAVVTSGTEEGARSSVETYGIAELLIDKERSVAKAYGSAGTPGAVLIDERGAIASAYAAGEAAINDLLIEAFGLTEVVAAVAEKRTAASQHAHEEEPDDHDHDHDHDGAAGGEPAPTFVDPDAIDPAFVATGKADVTLAEHEGETVLIDGATGAVHLLNPTAAVVWKCLDGSGTIDEIVADIADVFERDRAEVREGVLEVVRRFGRQGLLEGVGVAPAEEPEPAQPPA
ncbi:MAG TPA: PqqD family peptide modification chaperone [Actinomycetota bacterium]|nr:PqqD family peptide modification chaperone [Actinomycetota bacterium]